MLKFTEKTKTNPLIIIDDRNKVIIGFLFKANPPQVKFRFFVFKLYHRFKTAMVNIL
jgi:hypothetical protein